MSVEQGSVRVPVDMKRSLRGVASGSGGVASGSSSTSRLSAGGQEDEEDLWENPVFRSVRERVADFEEQACALGWIVLVPRLASLEVSESDDEGAGRGGGAGPWAPRLFPISFLKRHVVQGTGS